MLLAYFSAGGGGGGQPAKDALGNDVTSAKWLATHQPGARELTQGLKVGWSAHQQDDQRLLGGGAALCRRAPLSIAASAGGRARPPSTPTRFFGGRGSL